MPIIYEEKSQPVIVHTGKFTGRSPKDRYLVETNQSKDIIDWGERNQPISEIIFDKIFQKVREYLIQEVSYTYKGNVISDSKNAYGVELLTEERWYTQFAKNIFRNDIIFDLKETIKIYHAPSFFLKYEFDNINNKKFVILHPDK